VAPKALFAEPLRSVQRKLSEAAYKKSHKALRDVVMSKLESQSDRDRYMAVMTSRRAPGSGRFLDAPHGKDARFHLNDGAFAVACKVRMNLHVLPVVDGRVHCPGCKKPEDAVGPDITDRPDHILVCDSDLGTQGRTRTHTRVKMALLGAHRLCPSADATRERVMWDKPTVPGVDPTKFLAEPKPGAAKVRRTVTDILADISNTRYAVDTVVIAPTASRCTNKVRAARKGQQELHVQFATQVAEAQKNQHYHDRFIMKPNVRVVPFPMDVYGGLGDSSYKYLRNILVHHGNPKVPEHRRAANVTNTVQMLNVALARGLYERTLLFRDVNDPRASSKKSVRASFDKQIGYNEKKRFAAARAAARSGLPQSAAISAASAASVVISQQTTSLPAPGAAASAAVSTATSSSSGAAAVNAGDPSISQPKSKSKSKSTAKSTTSAPSSAGAAPSKAKVGRGTTRQGTISAWVGQRASTRRSTTPASSSEAGSSVIVLDDAEAAAIRGSPALSSPEHDE